MRVRRLLTGKWWTISLRCRQGGSLLGRLLGRFVVEVQKLMQLWFIV